MFDDYDLLLQFAKSTVSNLTKSGLTIETQTEPPEVEFVKPAPPAPILPKQESAIRTAPFLSKQESAIKQVPSKLCWC